MKIGTTLGLTLTAQLVVSTLALTSTDRRGLSFHGQALARRGAVCFLAPP